MYAGDRTKAINKAREEAETQKAEAQKKAEEEEMKRREVKRLGTFY